MRGFVNVFEQTSLTSWTQTQRIDFGTQLSFIHDVDIDNGILAVGASRQATLGGPSTYAVEIFEDSGFGYVPMGIIPSPVGSQVSWFGFSVALDGDRLLVGAPVEATHGAAYIYERNATGDWEEVSRLTASNFNERYHFGSEVALLGDVALITSWVGPGTISDGLVYVFQRAATGEWIEVDRLRPAESHPSFGNSLALVEGQLLVGAGVNAPGAVHIFSRIPEPSGFGQLLPIIALALRCRGRPSRGWSIRGRGWRFG
jgi:hypothetical protein